MKLAYEEFDLSGVGTYPLASRASKVRVEQFARPCRDPKAARDLVASFPRLLAADELRAAVEAIVGARRDGRPVIWAFGGHVVKTGLGPILVDLMERGFVSALATNGAGVIHDYEIALAGQTSEDVDEALGPGRFGMAEETGRGLNEIIVAASAAGEGLGQAVSRALHEGGAPYAGASLLASAARLGIPVTVHVAVGTDIIHMHPAASGAAIGETSLRDFRYLTSSVCRLAGGVFLNCGSAVVIPEVFLKAVALARNQGHSLEGLTTVNIDFLRMYRPETNVVRRPTRGVGRGISLTGHHEILIPLLAAAVIAADEPAT
ncbi:MAG: deoxyhypusine synthase family protein [Vicinamibacteraceae bacterium]|nr:deoxyhypusine synthase family protein [Vicinamibacteraceae bacterium]